MPSKGFASQRYASQLHFIAVRWICLASHGKVMALRCVALLGSGIAKHGSDGQMQSAARMAMEEHSIAAEVRSAAVQRNGLSKNGKG